MRLSKIFEVFSTSGYVQRVSIIHYTYRITLYPKYVFFILVVFKTNDLMWTKMIYLCMQYDTADDAVSFFSLALFSNTYIHRSFHIKCIYLYVYFQEQFSGLSLPQTHLNLAQNRAYEIISVFNILKKSVDIFALCIIGHLPPH